MYTTSVTKVNSMFGTVPQAMWTCLLHGTFLDAVSDILNTLGDHSYYMTWGNSIGAPWNMVRQEEG